MGAKRAGTRLKAKKKASAKTVSRKSSAKVSMPGKTTTGRRSAGKQVAATGVIPTTQKLARLVESMGNNWIAGVLGVSASQPSRWRTGEERMSPENARQVTDLEYVMSRLLQLYSPTLAKGWLESYNAHLEGRPVDVFRVRGALAVAGAIDAEAQGAYA
jgi:uncharacterized protein (DUF2384 family)